MLASRRRPVLGISHPGKLVEGAVLFPQWELLEIHASWFAVSQYGSLQDSYRVLSGENLCHTQNNQEQKQRYCDPEIHASPAQAGKRAGPHSVERWTGVAGRNHPAVTEAAHISQGLKVKDQR